MIGALSDFFYAESWRSLNDATYAMAAPYSPSVVSELRELLRGGTVKAFFDRRGLLGSVGGLQQGVRYEMARLTWCVLRNPALFGMSEDQVSQDEGFLEGLVCNLDVFAASVGIIYEDVPRRCLRPDEIGDLLEVVDQCAVSVTDEQPFVTSHIYPSLTTSSDGFRLNVNIKDSTTVVLPVMQLFAAWTLAHFSLNKEDQLAMAAADGKRSYVD